MSQERAHYWRHPALPDVDLLRARFITHRFGRHVHEGYNFSVIEEGVEEFEHRGTLLRAGPGSIVVVNPDTVHTGQAVNPEGWGYRGMYPSVELVADVAAELGLPPGTPHFPDTVLHDPAAAQLLSAAHRAGEHGDALAATSLLRSALAGMLRRHAQYSGTEKVALAVPDSVRAARDILHARLVEPPSLEELAEAVGVRPFSLLRAFRAATGLPPHAYLNQIRVREARRLLDAGGRPAEVATRTGFADQAHLTRHFKRTIGVPPGAYRRSRSAA
ncbi:AraC family transcriptional regulator [Actinomadura rudentiformis]|uniref:AraC family transcriptional regulator n=1 Tax=Actinomadura rudentiformis TaxID=359158 RepID=A0A6H9YCH1_9ACTN|nr:AraC family transcriptional regulator [Actinomadura rudentiformis]KAB2342772.1 AraC family transcriptional regulator [Actinomadura rudentiformis]